MKQLIFILLTLVGICSVTAQTYSDYPLSPVDFTHVKITDNFWRPRMETNMNVTIPHAFAKCESEGRIDNFIFAGGLKEGKWRGAYGFDDSDVYKVLEGASFTYQISKNPELLSYMDKLISYIAAAQEPDGYLYTAWTLRAKDYFPEGMPKCIYNKKPYDDMEGAHELYNAGHMYEAAVAHYQATGQRNFLDIAVKSADHVYNLFGPGKREGFPGHQEIEIGLVKLYRVTNDARYLVLAKLFLDRRGKGLSNGRSYRQDHKPVIEQDEAVGHAVRANYMYTAMTDIAALMGDEDYKNAVDNLWENVVGKKMYLTGGMGAHKKDEAYGRNYELPNISYAETCASIAGVYWNHRMFLLHGDAKYMDVLERILYNGLISGISLDGKKFFYPNVLHSDGHYGFNRGDACRSEWFDCSCCPTNDARFMSSIPGYIYAVKGNELYVNLYMSNDVDVTVDGNNVNLVQKTDYPWNGAIRLTVNTPKQTDMTIKLRIPSWAAGSPLPSDLYNYVNTSAPSDPTISINGQKAKYTFENGYAILSRQWSKGDVIELNLPMEVRQVQSHPLVKTNRGCIALEYGPIVYCLEEIDNGDVDLLILNADATCVPEFCSELLGGVTVITTEGMLVDENGSALSPKKLTAIPYYAWNNRNKGSMAVWIKTALE